MKVERERERDITFVRQRGMSEVTHLTNLVDEDDGGGIGLRVFEGLPQVRLRLPRQLTHDLRAVDSKAVSTGFRSHGPGDHRLTAAGGTEPVKS